MRTPQIIVTDSTFRENSIGIEISHNADFSIIRTLFEKNGIAIKEKDRGELDRSDLLEKTFHLISKKREVGAAIDDKVAVSASEASGLKAWLTDKGVDIANLGAALTALYLQWSGK